MARFLFGFSNFPTSSTVVRTAMKIAGVSGKFFEATWIYMGGAPAVSPQDFAYQAQIGWINNATIGTPGSVSIPVKMSYGGPTSALSCGIAYTAEPTAYDAYVVPLFGTNQRGGMVFQQPDGMGFQTDTASAMGLGIRVLSNTPGNIDGSMIYREP